MSVSRHPCGQFLGGVREALMGARAWKTHTATLAWGIVPAVLAGLIVGVMIIAAISVAPDLGKWAADRTGLDGGWGTAVTWLVAITTVLATGLVSIKLYVSIALIVGQPFYERISAEVDSLDPADAAEEEPWWVTTRRGTVDAVRLLAWTIPAGLAGFVVGFIPVVGPAVAFLIATGVGGWLLALELTAYPCARRGIVRFEERKRFLKADRARAWGFGVTVYVMMLIPGAALVVLPLATVGATTIVSDLTEEGSRPRSKR